MHQVYLKNTIEANKKIVTDFKKFFTYLKNFSQVD